MDHQLPIPFHSPSYCKHGVDKILSTKLGKIKGWEEGMMELPCNKTKATHASSIMDTVLKAKINSHIYNSISNISHGTMQCHDGETSLQEREIAKKSEKVLDYYL